MPHLVQKTASRYLINFLSYIWFSAKNIVLEILIWKTEFLCNKGGYSLITVKHPRESTDTKFESIPAKFAEIRSPPIEIRFYFQKRNKLNFGALPIIVGQPNFHTM